MPPTGTTIPDDRTGVLPESVSVVFPGHAIDGVFQDEPLVVTVP